MSQMVEAIAAVLMLAAPWCAAVLYLLRPRVEKGAVRVGACGALLLMSSAIMLLAV
jgi:hypothetical protein